MKPLAWLAISSGVAAATGIALLFARKGTVSGGAPPPEPSPTYGETVRTTLTVPSGWRRATSAEVAALPDLQARASSLQSAPGLASLPYGTLSPFVASNGKTYATWVEQHWHEPGGPVQPWGLHRGVTILAQAGGLGSLLDEWGLVRIAA